MKKLFLSLLLAFFTLCQLKAQNLDIDFLKNCFNYTDEEFPLKLSSKNFRLIEKDHKNNGDKLINKTVYFSNKTADNSFEVPEETALFCNTKHSKKSIFITFTKSIAFDNFNNLEAEIKKNFKKEGVLQSVKYDSSILKYSNEKNLYYLFKEEETYYLIISNYPLEETYFKE